MVDDDSHVMDPSYTGQGPLKSPGLESILLGGSLGDGREVFSGLALEYMQQRD